MHHQRFSGESIPAPPTHHTPSSNPTQTKVINSVTRSIPSGIAVAGTGQGELLSSLGADKVINYHEQPIESLDGTYDVLLDLSNKKRFKEIQHLLKKIVDLYPLNRISMC